MSAPVVAGPREMMAVSLARLLRDGETVFHGVASPLPMIAILLAKALHAPTSLPSSIRPSTSMPGWPSRTSAPRD